MGFGQAPGPQGEGKRNPSRDPAGGAGERAQGPLVSPSGVSHVPRGAAPLPASPLGPGSGGKERPVISFLFPRRMGNL